MIGLFSSDINVLHDTSEFPESKKALRNVVKRAIKQHNQQKISDDELKSLVEFAMMFEISAGLEKMMYSFEENVNKKIR